jgi:hypothetical protein
MDCEVSSFQGLVDTAARNLPPRRPTPMVVRAVVVWTPARLLAAFIAWVTEETPYPAPARTDA